MNDPISKWIQKIKKKYYLGTHFKDKRKKFIRIKFCTSKSHAPSLHLTILMEAKTRFGNRLLSCENQYTSPLSYPAYAGIVVKIKY